MKKIPPPKCTSCKGTATFESEVWPSVRLCFGCARDVAGFLHLHGITRRNPLLDELMVGPFREYDGKIQTWVSVGINTSRPIWLENH